MHGSLPNESKVWRTQAIRRPAEARLDQTIAERKGALVHRPFTIAGGAEVVWGDEVADIADGPSALYSPFHLRGMGARLSCAAIFDGEPDPLRRKLL